MNWGYRIMIAYIAGVAFLLYFVIGSMRTRTEMVEDNYYEKELVFNDQIEGRTNANRLSEKISISREGDSLHVTLDSSLSQQLSKGELYAYYAAGQQQDRRFSLAPTHDGHYTFAVSAFGRGQYIMRLSFTNGSKPYYKEQAISF